MVLADGLGLYGHVVSLIAVCDESRAFLQNFFRKEVRKADVSREAQAQMIPVRFATSMDLKPATATEQIDVGTSMCSALKKS